MAKAHGKPAFAYLMEMRTGKTKVVLDEFGSLLAAGLIDQLLVIAPGGVYETWKDEVVKHFGLIPDRIVLFHTWHSRNTKSELAIRASFLKSVTAKIFIINVEALSSVKAARAMVMDFLAGGRTMAVIDESTIIKSPSAKRTKFIIREVSTHAAVRRILSGLIAPRSPLDVYAQFEFLDPAIIGHRSYYTFRAQYAVMRQAKFGGRSVQLVVGFKDLKRLQSRLDPYSFRVRLEDCYDLPPKIYQVRHVPLTDEQRRLYNEMKEFATARIGEEAHVTATVVITQILRLHQILCGHVVDEVGIVHEIDENRTTALLELLEEHNGKAIIWCSYDADVIKISERLAKEYGPFSVARFWGGNRATREDEEARFKDEPLCLFMVATAAAGGRGRTWSVSDLVIYYSNTNNLEHRSQSEDRTQAIGKTRSVLYVDLIAPETVDEKIIHALRNKIDMASAINGDNYREWLV